MIIITLFSQLGFAEGNSDRCKRCHDEIKENWEESTHEARGIDCLSCHQTNMKVQQPKEQLCISCHSADSKQTKEKTRMPQQEMVKGTGGFGIKESAPSLMYASGVACIDCHMPKEHDHIFEIDTNEDEPVACISCHTGFQLNDMQRQIDRWQKETNNLMKKVEKLLKEKKVLRNRKLYQRAEFNYKFIKQDGSEGVHNPEYTQELLEVTYQMLKKL